MKIKTLAVSARLLGGMVLVLAAAGLDATFVGVANGAALLRHATSVSSNWSGYAVTAKRRATSFRQVDAKWVQPGVT